MEKYALICIIVATAVLLASTVMVVSEGSSHSDEKEPVPFDYEKFSSAVAGKGYETILKEMSDYIDVSDDEIEALSAELKSGKIVVTHGNMSEIGLNGIPLSESSEEDYSAYYYDGGNGASYTLMIGDDCSDIESLALNWIDTIQTVYADEAIPDYTRTFNQSISEGEFYVNELYYYLGTNNSGYKYYIVQYVMRSHSLNNQWKTADFWIDSQVNATNSSMSLLDSSPDNTYVMQSTTIGVNFSSNGIQGNVGWTWTTPVVLIHDQTIGNHFGKWFDVDESQAQLYEVVRPGCFVEVGPNTSFIMKENLKVQFEGPNPNHYWPWDPETLQKTIEIQTTNVCL